jgi:hypothetical protein
MNVKRTSSIKMKMHQGIMMQLKKYFLLITYELCEQQENADSAAACRSFHYLSNSLLDSDSAEVFGVWDMLG